MALWFLIKILSLRSLFGFDTEKKKKITPVCNVEIPIEETLSLGKARAVIQENVKISIYQNIKIATSKSIKWER